ncbi:MAG TPA: heparin lyase I family protein [Solirubrobacterales bacterium]|nr:heparin lyase I family protein [Solirubrobacterales bacterium]
MPSIGRHKRLLALCAGVFALAALIAASVSAAQPPVRGQTLSASHAVRHLHQRMLRHRRRVERRRGRPSSAGLLFSGSKIDDFADNQSAPGAVSEVPNPAGGEGKVLKMTVSNSDVAPITPTDNPRAQLVTPAFVEPGDETWWHTSFYLPKDFPREVPGWLTVLEGPYGAPYDGSPPVSLSVDEDEIRFQRGDTYKYDVPWHAPIERGKWIDVLFHTRFGSNGFVELWINGQQVTFFDSPGDRNSFNPFHEAATQRLEMETRDHTNDGGPNFFVIQNYRKAGMFNSLTVYHGPTQIGTTREAVDLGPPSAQLGA